MKRFKFTTSDGPVYFEILKEFIDGFTIEIFDNLNRADGKCNYIPKEMFESALKYGIIKNI